MSIDRDEQAVRNLLQESGAVFKRLSGKQHEVWGLSNGKKFVCARPGAGVERRAWRNNLSDLRRLLGLKSSAGEVEGGIVMVAREQKSPEMMFLDKPTRAFVHRLVLNGLNDLDIASILSKARDLEVDVKLVASLRTAKKWRPRARKAEAAAVAWARQKQFVGDLFRETYGREAPADLGTDDPAPPTKKATAGDGAGSGYLIRVSGPGLEVEAGVDQKRAHEFALEILSIASQGQQ